VEFRKNAHNPEYFYDMSINILIYTSVSVCGSLKTVRNGRTVKPSVTSFGRLLCSDISDVNKCFAWRAAKAAELRYSELP